MALEDLTTGLDLFDYVMSRGGQPGGSTDDYAALVKAAIRKAYVDILMLEPWYWALSPSPGVLSIAASQNVTVSSISTVTWTLSATIAASQAGRKIYFNATSIPYRIDAHTAGTAALTCDASYAETTPTSGSAVIVKDEYALDTNCLKPWGPMKVRSQHHREVDLIPPKQFKSENSYIACLVPGYTQVASVLRANTSQVQMLTIWPPSSEAFILEYDFTKKQTLDFSGSGAADTPVLPQPDRWVIAERALFELREVKEDTLADSANLLHNRKLDEMRTAYLGLSSRQRMWGRRGAMLGAR